VKACVLSTAKLREPSLVERYDYYQKLLNRRIPLERRDVKKGPLLPQVPSGYLPIALHERGEAWDSVAFAERVRGWERSVQGLCFLIGEADGLAPSDLSGAAAMWSLSPLTLPHQLCFVIVAEQLYRAHTIIRGESYHRP
jgi:23S rRNA (pseudouridine1915-N3)-methyltransferase